MIHLYQVNMSLSINGYGYRMEDVTGHVTYDVILTPFVWWLHT